jgi:hypothetical protein
MDNFNRISTELLQIVRNIGEALEGNCVTYHNTTDIAPELTTKQENIFTVANFVPEHGNILEIGFNAGHSATLLLLGSKHNVTFTAIDINIHKYVTPCFQHLKKHCFPERTTNIILGDSRDVLSTLPTQHFDLIHLDGGHEFSVALSDTFNAIHLLKSGGFLLFDDTQSKSLQFICHTLISSSLFTSADDLIKPTQLYKHRLLRKKIT